MPRFGLLSKLKVISESPMLACAARFGDELFEGAYIDCRIEQFGATWRGSPRC